MSQQFNPKENRVKNLLFVAVLVTSAALAQDKTPRIITAAQASDHVGTVATVCGKVISNHVMDPGVAGYGRPVAFALDGPNLFNMITFGAPLKDDNSLEHRDKTSEQVVAQFMGKSVCVTGKIEKRNNDQAAFIFERDRTKIKIKK